MKYFRVTFTGADPGKKEILTARLFGIGAEGIEEKDDRVEAWFGENVFPETELQVLSRELELSCRKELVPAINWNAAWEASYEPVVIAGRCYVRAPFHPSRSDLEIELVIEPRMSFGTAHHETTVLMAEAMLATGFTGKKVLDMGCGTGILAILAEKLGAPEVLAVDNDEWAVDNTADNLLKNNCSRITVKKGETDAVEGTFDSILANINRNVLVEQMPFFSRSLKPGGLLFLSGFYAEDAGTILATGGGNGFREVRRNMKNNWTFLLLEKQ